MVSTSPAELGAARNAAAARAREDAKLAADFTLLNLSTSGTQGLARLQRERRRWVPELRKQLESQAPNAEFQRAHAAFLLTRLDDPQGIAAARRMVSSRGMTRAVLVQLPSLSAADLAKVPGVEALVLENLAATDAGMRQYAVGAAALLKTPATIRALRALVRDGKDLEGAAAQRLAQLAPDAELLDLCISSLSKATPDSVGSWLSALALIAEKSPRLAPRAIDACVRGLETSGGALGFDEGMRAALQAIERRAGQRASSLLRRLVSAEKALPLVRTSALNLLVKRDPALAKSVALRSLSTPELTDAAVEALGHTARGTADATLTRTLLALSQGPGNPRGTASVKVRALLEIGGDLATHGAIGLANQLPPEEQVELRWLERGISPETALSRFEALQILDHRAVLRVRTALSGQLKSQKLTPGSGFIRSVFEAAGLLATFDVETGELPVRHDRLLRELAAHCAGRFQAEAAWEHWDRTSEEDEEGDYTVQFIHAGRLYRFRAGNLGDWYDLPAVLTAVNRALSDAGEPRRFVPLNGDGQTAAILFVDPQAYSTGTKELFLPPVSDAGAPRREGREFEDHVISELRKRH